MIFTFAATSGAALPSPTATRPQNAHLIEGRAADAVRQRRDLVLGEVDRFKRTHVTHRLGQRREVVRPHVSGHPRIEGTEVQGRRIYLLGQP